jgi:hypothetical protein
MELVVAAGGPSVNLIAVVVIAIILIVCARATNRDERSFAGDTVSQLEKAIVAARHGGDPLTTSSARAHLRSAAGNCNKVITPVGVGNASRARKLLDEFDKELRAHPSEHELTSGELHRLEVCLKAVRNLLS